MVLSNPGTQYMSLSAGIAQEPVSMTPRLMAETFCFAPAQTLASPSRVRWPSAVDSTIELACTIAHRLSCKKPYTSGSLSLLFITVILITRHATMMATRPPPAPAAPHDAHV